MTFGMSLLTAAAVGMAIFGALLVIALLVAAVVGLVLGIRYWRQPVAVTSGGATAPVTYRRGRERQIFGVHVDSIRRPGLEVFGAPIAASLVGLVAGGAALFWDDADAAVVPAVVLLSVAVLGAVVIRERRGGGWDRRGVLLIGLLVAFAAAMLILPAHLYGGQVNAVIHRSAISGPVLLTLSALSLSYAVRGWFGATPSAQDISLYPLIAVPVLLVLVVYGLLLGRVVVQGAGGLSWDLLTTAWGQIPGQGAGSSFVYQAGLRNHILGTLLLMGMTCLISFIPGVAVGVFLSEYPGRLARLIGFSTTMLRAMSVFIIGVAALGFVGAAVNLSAGSALPQLIRGSFTLDAGGVVQPGSGSFLTASLFLSLLVIPIIAKLTEEGLRSVPRDIREGSAAAGATAEYGLRRILLPWAGPNIITGILLGAAEAAGSLAIIMFVAGNGEHGVGPLTSVTSLDYALFSTRFGTQPFIQSMGYRAPVDYAFTSALLLLVITLGLTVVAMVVRRRFARRYRGSLTVG